MKFRFIFTVCAGILVVLLASSAAARVKMVSLPERGDVVIRLDNPAATLIEEERILALQKGLNRVDFSWKGVRIDPDSIRLTLIEYIAGHWEMKAVNSDYELKDAQTLVFEIDLGPGEKKTLNLHYVRKNIRP